MILMDIIKNRDGKKLDVKLTGKLDTKTSPELTDALKDELDDVEELNFDFSELIYISSSGLRVILSTYKIMNKQGSMKISHVQDIVMEVFNATGLNKILTIE